MKSKKPYKKQVDEPNDDEFDGNKSHPHSKQLS